MKYSFGERLRELRMIRGLSQEDLADKLNARFGSSINKGMISKWENDKEEPRMEAVRNISVFFNVALDELMDLAEFTPKEERDIAKKLQDMMDDLGSGAAMAFMGEPMDEEDKELLRISLENTIRLSKQMAKKKFTPKKYRE
jgi:transcriptional regulator with XRE-family HTH domain